MSNTHFVNKNHFDPNAEEPLTQEQERYYLATQWQLMWWKLKRHRLAMVSGAVLAFMYFSVVIAELLAPYALASRNTDFIYAPPQKIHFFHEGELIGPFVYGLNFKLNMKTLRREYTENTRTLKEVDQTIMAVYKTVPLPPLPKSQEHGEKSVLMTNPEGPKN